MLNAALMFGGTNGAFVRDTWEYIHGPASYTTFGVGCAGSVGVPSLQTQFGAVPVANRSFTVQVNNLPLTGAAWMFFGVSQTNWSGVPLPFNLGTIGMTGCTLYSSGEFAIPIQNVLGVGVWTVNLPASVAGATFYNQAIILDIGATPLGLIVSDAACAVVGG